jgi:hypothetical protein
VEPDAVNFCAWADHRAVAALAEAVGRFARAINANEAVKREAANVRAERRFAERALEAVRMHEVLSPAEEERRGVGRGQHGATARGARGELSLQAGAALRAVRHAVQLRERSRRDGCVSARHALQALLVELTADRSDAGVAREQLGADAASLRKANLAAVRM